MGIFIGIKKIKIMVSIVTVISIIMSGCVDQSKQYNVSTNVTQIAKNGTQVSIYDDNKFIEIVKEADNIIENNNLRLMKAAERGDFENVQKYGKNLEYNTTRYMSILKDLTVSPRLEGMYFEYYNYLEIMKETGIHIQESAKRHESIDTNVGLCNDPSVVHDQQMELL